MAAGLDALSVLNLSRQIGLGAISLCKRLPCGS